MLEISQITQGLKAIAKELAVPVLALSQLSRAVESREDKRPQLSDLRESGTIEQDADVVMFVYRDEYYLQQRAPKQMAFDTEDKFQAALDKWQRDMEQVHNKAELLIEKQRHGPTGKIDLFFEGEFTRFADLDRAPRALTGIAPAAELTGGRPRRDRRQLAPLRARHPAGAGRGAVVKADGYGLGADAVAPALCTRRAAGISSWRICSEALAIRAAGAGAPCWRC